MMLRTPPSDCPASPLPHEGVCFNVNAHAPRRLRNLFMERIAMTGEAEILNANAAYYRAFRQGDDALMGRVWHEADVVCLHPGWPPITGRAAVLASYRRIMSNPNQPPVTCHDEQVIITGDVARVICVEAVAGAQLIATNLFLRSGAEWRLIHHHASLLSAPRTAFQPPTLN